jgi:hypothetical protein
MFHIHAKVEILERRENGEEEESLNQGMELVEVHFIHFVQLVDANTVPASQNPFAPYMNTAPVPPPPTFVQIILLTL